MLFGTHQYTTSAQAGVRREDPGVRCEDPGVILQVPNKHASHIWLAWINRLCIIYTSTSKHGIRLGLISKGSSRNSGLLIFQSLSKKLNKNGGKKQCWEWIAYHQSTGEVPSICGWDMTEGDDKGIQLFFFSLIFDMLIIFA